MSKHGRANRRWVLLWIAVWVSVAFATSGRACASEEEEEALLGRSLALRFNQFYFDAGAWKETTFLGVTSMQNPCDNWVVQELISEIKPDFLISTEKVANQS